MLEIGSVVDGKYKILNQVGSGGMSVVYLAMNEKANKQWAIKEVRKDGVKDFEIVKQSLVAETDMLKKLSHPYLPSIIDVIEDEDCFLIVMDYIEGNSLASKLEEFGAQPQEDVVHWARQLCDVLGYLHSRVPPIIYRDMKPANVMLKPDGNVTLIDFGIAREYKDKGSGDTTWLGTIGYAAPEQFGGMGQTDARTDIYCLGTTLYHLLTGRNPCEPPYEIQPIREINPALSSGLERIIQKCTQKNPDDRFQSAAELMYALEHYNEIDEVFRKKQKRKLAAFVTAGMLSAVCAVTSLWSYLSAERKLSENYEEILQRAVSTEDYYKAIVIDPAQTEAYFELNNSLMADGILTVEEGQELLKLRTGLEQVDGKGFSQTYDVLETLKEDNIQGYYEVCYEIGYSFLNYETDFETDLYNYAAMWFEETKDSEDNYTYPDAQIYCDIAECLKLISQYSNTKIQQTDKIYDQYTALLQKLSELRQSAVNYEDIDQKLQAWAVIEQLINSNVVPLLEIETEQDEVEDILDKIYQEAEEILSDESVKSVIKEEMQSLMVSIEETQKRIMSAKQGGTES